MSIDRAAWPFVAVGCTPAVVALVAGWTLTAAGLAALPVAIALFFRDPERAASREADVVAAPADGTVMHAGAARPDEAPPGRWLQVTIFLSVLDVHINRTPVAGVVKAVKYVAGGFLPAFRPEAWRNEHSEIWIDHDGVQVVTRQVVGVLARRVVCRVRPGDRLGPGDRIGLMKFGSRMDVFLPESAELLVSKGQHVRGGETPIARLRHEAHS